MVDDHEGYDTYDHGDHHTRCNESDGVHGAKVTADSLIPQFNLKTISTLISCRLLPVMVSPPEPEEGLLKYLVPANLAHRSSHLTG